MIAANDELRDGTMSSTPVPRPCLSYWQRTTRAYPHLHSNSTITLPAASKYVIIGSGISGALTAFELIENGVTGADIVILEAREAASGASGRNAGHVRPDAFRGFSHYASIHGSEQALKILANERLVLDKVDAFVRKHNVPCDFDLTTTFDVCMTEAFAKYEAHSLEAFRKAGADTSHVKYYEGEEAVGRTRVAGAVSAYEWPAGSSHPAKLAQWLLSQAISRGVTLFTHCPVSRITRSEVDGNWEISTSRGVITAPTVVHATNAYASLLLPQLEPYLTPNRAQAHSVIAPSSLSGSGILSNTFSLRYSLEHFYSLIQRRGDGTLILGVSRLNPTLRTETLKSIVSFDDRHCNEEILDDALKQAGILFPELKVDVAEGEIHGEGLDHAWTGIIGMTTDRVPFVGRVPGLDGQWICAGFVGHGMARIFTCAPGLAKLMAGKDWSETGLPECFQMSKERISKMDAMLRAK